MRNTKRGSWFIQELNTALRFHARDTHLADILVQVNISILYCMHNRAILPKINIMIHCQDSLSLQSTLISYLYRKNKQKTLDSDYLFTIFRTLLGFCLLKQEIQSKYGSV